MKLHTVFITYNRLELTKATIESYLETVTVPFTFRVVDNGSTDGTQEWLQRGLALTADLDVIDIPSGSGWKFLSENRYPGYAANKGWSLAPADATHLHRSDNDFRYLPGWCEEVERLFSDPKMGQVGLRTDKEEGYEPGNTGGNCVIRRELWDAGLRYDERPWGEFEPGYSEDSFFSPKVVEMGWKWARVKRKCIQNLASGDWKDPYYVESYGKRGIRPRRNDPTVPEGWDKGYAGDPR
jgi:glycosyltransferase involved in cell wall biosynthesis